MLYEIFKKDQTQTVSKNGMARLVESTSLTNTP